MKKTSKHPIDPKDLMALGSAATVLNVRYKWKQQE